MALSAVALAVAGLGTGRAEAAAPAWRVLAATGPTDLPPVTEEVQRLSVDASGGAFKLGFEGLQTDALPFDAGPTAIRDALDALPDIGGVGGSTKVTGGPGNPGAENAYLVSFGGALAGHDVAALVGDAAGLQGGASTVTVTTPVEGKESFEAGSLAVSVTNVGGAPSSFLPTLTVNVGPLPAGIETRSVEERGWSCPAGAEGAVVACTHLFPVGALESADTIRIPLTVHGPDVTPGSRLHIEVVGGEAAPVDDDAPLAVKAAPAGPGVAAFWAGAFDADGRPETRAGAHPYSASSAFWLNTVLATDGVTILPAGALRTAKLGLPAGFLGDPLATQQRCPQAALAENPDTAASPDCTREGSLVGALYPAKGVYSEVSVGGSTSASPIFNDVPALGTAAQFTANIAAFGEVSFLGSVRSEGDFGVDLGAFNLSTQQAVYGTVTTLEGFPASTAGGALLRNPTDCDVQREEAQAGRGPLATLQTNSWINSDPRAIEGEVGAPQPVVVGCAALTDSWIGNGPEPAEERPTFSFQPSVTQGSSGTGATARIHVPQRGLTDPDRLGSSDLKKTVVALPKGLSLNPSAAEGLQSCSESQVGYTGSGFAMPNPIRFDEAPVTCPEASRLGTVQIKSPLLDEELGGTIYLAAQEENPFHSLIALYLVVESERFGVTLKLPGEVEAGFDRPVS